MKFVFLGPPGAGKGTLAVEAAKLYNIPHISTGDIFRAAIKNQTELGKKVKSVIDSGALVSDELTVALVKERLEKADAQKGFILDGFPRTIPQAEALENIVKIGCVVNFDISDEEVIRRLSGRRICPDCGQSFHTEFVKPKKENICDSCGSALIIREDDKIESIKKRLETYRVQTAPLIDFYKNKKLLKDIDARPAASAILEVFKNMSG